MKEGLLEGGTHTNRAKNTWISSDFGDVKSGIYSEIMGDGLAPNLQYRFIFGHIWVGYCVVYFCGMKNLDQLIHDFYRLNRSAELE